MKNSATTSHSIVFSCEPASLHLFLSPAVLFVLINLSWFPLIILSCSSGTVLKDAREEEELIELMDAENELESGIDIEPATEIASHDGDDIKVEGEEYFEAKDFVIYDGPVPEIPVFEKDTHIASCMRTRACFPENPQQLATCTSAYGYILGRETGITLAWVAQCVVSAPQDCDAIRDCLSNGQPQVPCDPLTTLDTCTGTVLRQCSRASGLIFAFDCLNVGMDCFIDSDGNAICGLGYCDPSNFYSSCFGNILIYCQKGVITVADCTAAGLICLSGDGNPGRCAGAGQVCDESTTPRLCNGEILSGCIGGRIAEIDCSELIENWTCGESEGTAGCIPSGNECHAYPLLGSDIDENCNGNCVVTCLDGYIQQLCCDDFGLGECIDLGRAARCSGYE